MSITIKGDTFARIAREMDRYGLPGESEEFVAVVKEAEGLLEARVNHSGDVTFTWLAETQ